MSKKKKPKEDDSTVAVSKSELKRLTDLAKAYAEQTETLDDDEFIDDFEESISDVGDTVDQKIDSRWELDENPIIDSLRHELRRERMNKNGNWIRPHELTPIVNSKGESDILWLLRSSLTKNIALGNISRTEANTLTHDVIESLIYMVANKWRQWDFDKAYRDVLVATVRSHVYSHLTRPINQGEKEYRRGSSGGHDMYDDDLYNRRDPFMNGLGRDNKKEYNNNDNEVMNI